MLGPTGFCPPSVLWKQGQHGAPKQRSPPSWLTFAFPLPTVTGESLFSSSHAVTGLVVLGPEKGN